MADSSFDVVSKYDKQEVANAVNNAAKEMEGTNVYTFWGTLYQYGGFIGGLAVCSIIYGVLYILLFVRKSIEFVVLYSVLLMAMSFAWFEYYYWHLYFYECTVFAVLFWVANRLFGVGNWVKKGEGP